MSEDQPRPGHSIREENRSARHQLMTELIMFFRKKREKSSRWDWLNSPLFLALIGGSMATVITLAWQSCEERRVSHLETRRQTSELRLDILRRFSHEFAKSSTSLRHWGEKNIRFHVGKFRSDTDRDNAWSEIIELEKETRSLNDLEGELTQIEVAFDQEKVRDLVRELRVVWKENCRKTDNWVQCPTENSDKAEQREDSLVKASGKLNDIYSKLLIEMLKEMKG